jgi:hypothetical protein
MIYRIGVFFSNSFSVLDAITLKVILMMKFTKKKEKSKQNQNVEEIK